MQIQTLPSGPYSTNAYVVACSKTGEAAIIDPGADSTEKIFNYLEKNKLHCKKIWLTHSHWDHIVDVHPLMTKLGAEVSIHAEDAPNLEKPGADGLPFWLPLEGIKPHHLWKDNEKIPLGQLNFTILHTPGHSPGSVCLYEPHHAVLFSGDTLFKGSIGNLSFPTSQPAKMWPSLAKLERLPPETKVYPGHGAMTIMENELKWLPRAKELYKEI
jgi:hydroxyacylglutathione hydrolase